VLVSREELVATVGQRVCVPLFASSHADLGLSGRGTIIFPTFADQCDNIASLLILCWLLGVVVFRSEDDQVVWTKTVLCAEDSVGGPPQTNAEIGGWDDFVCRQWPGVGYNFVQL